MPNRADASNRRIGDRAPELRSAAAAQPSSPAPRSTAPSPVGLSADAEDNAPCWRARSPVAPKRSSKSSARDDGGCRAEHPANRVRAGSSIPMARSVRHSSENSRRSDLRRVVIGAAVKILQRIKPDDAARRGARGTAGALRGGCLADARDFERGQSGPRRIARDARQAAVDYRGDAVDGDGAFGDVGGKNHFSLRRRARRRDPARRATRSPCSGRTRSSCFGRERTGIRARRGEFRPRLEERPECRRDGLSASRSSSAEATCFSSGSAE